MNDKVAIVGVAQTQFKPNRSDVNVAELAYEAIEQVMTETGLNMKKDIQGRITCSHDIWDGQTISNIGITDVSGGHLRSEEKMAMDGLTAVYYGAISILSGEFDCMLLLAHTKMSQTNRNIVNNVAFDPLYTRQLGFDYTSAGALQAKRYMHKYGISQEQIAGVAAKNLKNALNNPNAHNKGDYSVKDILESPLSASPIHEMEMAPDTDGAVAIILASEKKAQKITDTPVWINGIGACYDAHYLGDRDLSDTDALTNASNQAYRMAGIKSPKDDIDVIELGDEFSYQELLWLEGLGICDKGEAGKLFDKGHTQIDGDIPVNPSGGLISGVPANVMGLNRAAEASLQLMGKAGNRQIKDAKTAIAQGHSGFCGQHQCVVVLGANK